MPALRQKRRGIDRHVGTRLVDHRDDTERDRHLSDPQAIRPDAVVRDPADGVGQGGDVAQALQHVAPFSIREREPPRSGASTPFSSALATSFAFAARIFSRAASSRAAAQASHSFFWRVPSSAVNALAERAAPASARISAARAGEAVVSDRSRSPRVVISDSLFRTVSDPVGPLQSLVSRSSTRSSRWMISSPFEYPSTRSIAFVRSPASRATSIDE